MAGISKEILNKRVPFNLLGKTDLLLRPLGRADYDALNQWVKKQYMANVKEATSALDPTEKQEFLLAALSQASKLTFQYGDGREILMESAYGLSRLAYQLIDKPMFSFEEFNGMLFPDTFLNLEGMTAIAEMIETTYQHIEKEMLDAESRFIKERMRAERAKSKSKSAKTVKAKPKTAKKKAAKGDGK